MADPARRDDPRPVASRRVARPAMKGRAALVAGFLILLGSALAAGLLQAFHPDGFDLLYHRSPAAWFTSPDNAEPAAPEPVEAGTTEARLATRLAGRALLRVSSADRNALEAAGGRYDAFLDETEAALEALGLTVTRTTCMPSGRERALFILPFGWCLSDAAYDSLDGWVRGGGSLCAVGAVGVRDAGGTWAGWDRTLSLTGASEATLLRGEDSDFVTVARAAPVAPAWQHGYRLALKRGEGVALRAEKALVEWTRFGREGVPRADTWFAAAITRVRGRGRLLWLGFPPSWIHEEAGNLAAGRALLTHALVWCRGDVAVAELDPWPGGAEAAVLVEEDSEAEFKNVEALARALDARGLPGTFLCLSNLARWEAGKLRAVAARHEIGSHTDDHRVIADAPEEKQRKRLARSASALSRISRRDVVTFRPPEERWDEGTVAALMDLGYTTLVAGRHPQAQPEILRAERPGGWKTLVRVPRVTPDDFETEVDAWVPRDSLVEVYASALRRVRRFGGVDLVSLHTHLLGRPDRLPAFEAFLDTVAAAPVWCTTAGELGAWWLARSEVHVSANREAGGAFRLNVANRGASVVRGGVAWVALPRGERLPGADASGAVSVHLPDLSPGDSLSIPIGQIDS